MRRLSPSLIIAIGLILPVAVSAVPIPAAPMDTIVSGSWEIEYLVLDPEEHLIPVAFRSPGMEQRVRLIHRGYRITVTCFLEPLSLPISASVPEIPAPGDGVHPVFSEPTLQNRLENARSIPGLTRAVMAWIDDMIPYRDEADDPQDVDSVLNRRSGNCVGRAATAAQLLITLGIPARTIRGCLFKDDNARFHRWLEIDYPGIGALPADPGSTLDFVTPYHLVLLPNESADPTAASLADLGASIRIERESRSVWTTDLWPIPEGASTPITRRQPPGPRIHAAVTGSITGTRHLPCRILLQNSDYSHALETDAFGNFSFVPVVPGTYHLIIQAGGRDRVRTQVVLESGKRVHVSIPLNK
ncbi:hypothetical protein JXA80_14725 [bacterium]|nr:hypothetical protein [candidate division CSSED10-310 bacterium]